MDRYVLTNAQWAKMEPHCRGKKSEIPGSNSTCAVAKLPSVTGCAARRGWFTRRLDADAFAVLPERQEFDAGGFQRPAHGVERRDAYEDGGQ